jgi:predicted RNA binding protein YcfA (HicA-like mRNA interferase family)
MSKLPLLKPEQLARILAKLGFRLVRQEGSHMFFEHTDGRTTVVPCHLGRNKKGSAEQNNKKGSGNRERRILKISLMAAQYHANQFISIRPNSIG